MNLKSESENRYKSHGHCQYEKQNFLSENKNKNNENKDVKTVKVRSREALTKMKAKLTAKVNEVKAIEKTLTGPRIKRKKQLNEKIGSEPTSTLPSCFTAMCNIFFFLSTYLPFLSSKMSFQVPNQTYPICRTTSFKHLLLENSVIARYFVCHNIQPQCRQKPQ
jgi:hypothetical protein